MKYVVGNWKQKMNLAGLTAWLNAFVTRFPTGVSLEKTLPIIAPSYPYLHVLSQSFTADLFEGWEVASQDVSPFDRGSHTGSVGAFQLADFVKFSIIGHSELGESSAVVLQKRDKLLAHGIVPILCFADSKVARQYYTEGVILAWEDPGNISTSDFKTVSLEEVQSVVSDLRTWLPVSAPLLYGGSVTPDNSTELANIGGLDGVLVGRASLKAQDFVAILNNYERHEN